MRTFKILVTTIVLLAIAGVALVAIKQFIPSTEPELGETYHEDEHLEIDDVYSKQLKQYEGTVKILGLSIYQEGTHRLEKDDKLVLILGSEKVNLLDFEGKEVKVRGFVRDTVEGGQKIMEVAYLEPIAEAGVKYFNEVGYEFGFSYPSDWEIKKEADKVTFTRKKEEENETLLIVYQYENVKETLETWLKNRDQNLFYEEAQVKVGQSTGVRRTVKNGDQVIIKTYVKEGNNAYEVRLVSQDEVIRNQYFSIVDFFKTSFTVEQQPEAEAETSVEEEEEAPQPDGEEETPEEEEAPAEEDLEKESIPEQEPSSEQPSEEGEESGQSFSNLEPLSQSDIDKVLEKGFSPFQGRTLGFDYPKLWYFTYLGDGKYGFTDDATYKANSEEITEETSRVLIVVGNLSVSCTDTATKTIDDTTYSVCAREPGLGGIIDHMGQSISKPE
ncbi:MAG: hypothetical protein AB7J40_02960 [Candidatus Altimarinota bacterium]